MHLIAVREEFVGQMAASHPYSQFTEGKRWAIESGGKEERSGCSRGTEQMGVGDKTRTKSDSTIIAF